MQNETENKRVRTFWTKPLVYNTLYVLTVPSMGYHHECCPVFLWKSKEGGKTATASLHAHQTPLPVIIAHGTGCSQTLDIIYSHTALLPIKIPTSYLLFCFFYTMSFLLSP